MSNIFAPYCRWNRRVPVSIGAGEYLDGSHSNQHLNVTSEGQIICGLGTPIHHYGDALPFDVDGRLVIGNGDIFKWDQGIPFTVAGYVAVQEDAPVWFDQGVGFTETGHLSIGVEGTIIPGEYFKYYNTDPGDQSITFEDMGLQPAVNELGFQVVFILKEDFDPGIPDLEVIASLESLDSLTAIKSMHHEVAGGLAVVMEDSGFQGQTSHVKAGVQGQVIDLRWQYATTDLESWVDQADKQVASYDPFTRLIEVLKTYSTYYRIVAVRIVQPAPGEVDLLAWPTYSPPLPLWSVIPDQFNYKYELPDTLDVTPYVTGSLTDITLVTPPSGFTINSGIITADDTVAVGIHTITVRAHTTDFTTADTSFQWEVITGNVPTWGTIPNQSNRENDLPKTLDVKPYASSDSGPITSYSLVTPPNGITILNGVITVAAGTAVGSYVLTVRATNGVGAADTVFTWDVLEALKTPQWSQIPNQTDVEADLPQTLNAALYVTSNAGSLRNWTLVTPPPGFTIDQSGVITCAAGTAITDHSIVVSVENDLGAESTGFTWTVAPELLPPQWQTIPDQTTSEELLPAILDASAYVSSNSGPLTGWTLTAPAGFSISVAGLITASAAIAPGVYQLSVEVTNDTGTTSSNTFDWEIELFYLVPQWSTIPGQSTGDDDLPTTLDVAPYVTTNSGPLTAWALVTPPAGFTIDAAGVITVAGGTALNTYSITVQVDNDEGTGTSMAFSWLIFDTPLPPQWDTVPNQTTREDNLPQNLDMTNYVTSNSGPLTGWGLTAPAGFSINAAGLVTAAAGIEPGVYSLQVQVTNNEGTEVSNTFDWEVELFFLVPQWSTIPDQSTEEQLLPVVLDVKPYVTSNHGSLRNWSLPGAPSGWTIDSNGVITVATARPVGSNSITVSVDNDSGSNSSAAFAWDILEEPLPPQWETIPDKQTRENLLPQTYNISTYVSSNSGPLTGWALVNPPAGFTISGAGVITAAAGTTVAVHNLTVRVSNDTGTEDSAVFSWEIQEELLPPQWNTVPDKETREDVLPQTYDMSLYVTSNAGNLVLWRLASAPAGFSISSSTGIITASNTLGVSNNSLRVGVTNSVGEELSNTFSWDILEELLVPQWTNVPDQSHTADNLPQTLDVSPYVSSNAGPLDTWSLVSPPTGFTIDQSGVITVAAGTAQAAHAITVRVLNDIGAGDHTFTWTIEPPAVKQYFHEFNADYDPSFWSFTRNSQQTGLDNNTIRRNVGNQTPVYPLCNWGGSSFTPNAGFRGILLEGETTNQFWWSTKFFPASEVNWKYNGGWGTKSPTNQGAQSSMNQVGPSNTQTIQTWDARSDDGPGRDIGFSNDNGGAITWKTMPDGLYAQMSHPQAPRGEQVCTMSNRHSNQSWSYDWWQLELGTVATSQIETFAATGTRARCFLNGDPSTFFEIAELNQDWAMQWKFSMENPISRAPGGAWGIFTMADSGNGNDNCYAYVGPTYIAFTITRAGTTYSVVFDEAGVAGIQREDEIDLRIKWTASGITCWLKYPGQALYKKTNATAISAWPTLNRQIWAMRLVEGGSSSVNDNPACLKTVRIEAPAPSDAEIEGWT